jgi:hypothetical protein
MKQKKQKTPDLVIKKYQRKFFNILIYFWLPTLINYLIICFHWQKNCLTIEFCTLRLECCDFIYFSVAINIVMNSSPSLVCMAKANGSFRL